MVELQQRPDGVLLPVRALAGARTDALRGWQDGHLKVAVTQIPEKGKANKAIVELLAKRLKLRRSQIKLVNGTSSSQKQFLVEDISPAELIVRIESALAS